MKKLIATTLALISIPALAGSPCEEISQVAYDASAMYQSGYSRYHVEQNPPKSNMLYDKMWLPAVRIAVLYLPEQDPVVQDMVNDLVKVKAKRLCERGHP